MCECVCVCLYVFESKTEFDFAGLFYASNECCGLFKYVKSEKSDASTDIHNKFFMNSVSL